MQSHSLRIHHVLISPHLERDKVDYRKLDQKIPGSWTKLLKMAGPSTETPARHRYILRCRSTGA
jgi:hypothetical protein